MDQLLTTKLFIHKPRPDLVPRPRLIARLNEGLHRKLTLISAPAGFGKTTLVSEWVAACGRPAAWLSLDNGDNDTRRFLTYLVSALQTLDLGGGQTMAANFGKGVLAALQSSQPPSSESILTNLLNEIAAIPEDFSLVLDDYHMIESAAVDENITFLLENMPPQMHLLITTREDPPLPLPRLRARDQLVELRATDLRFTLSEAANFLNQVMGLDLSADDTAALENRTEGWIAGLQLAAISMRGREDVHEFVTAFAGDHRYIMDYLVEEVLQRQPEAVRAFLLQTSILRRLSGPLCDAVIGRPGSSPVLETLERGNLFVIPLDDRRRWYRYHHLFGDVLQAHLREEQPASVPALHQRASEWCEHNGMLSEAVHHALAAEDFERVAYLAEPAWRKMTVRFKSGIWLDWVKALPDELVRASPVLSLGYGWALLDAGELEAADLRLRDAERWLDTPAGNGELPEAPPARMVVVDEAEFQSLQGVIANARAYLAQALDDSPAALEYARRAYDLLPEDDYFERGLSALLQGLALWSSGDLAAARPLLIDAVSNMRLAGNIPFTISFTSYLADLLIAQGCLNEAVRIYLQLLETVMEGGEPVIPEAAALHLGLTELYLEQGNPETAQRHLQRGANLGEQPAFPPWYRHWFLAQAGMKKVQGDLDGMLDTLNEAERLYYRHPIPDVRPLAAQKTRAWLMQGRLPEALAWVSERGLAADDGLEYIREYEHITLARVLIAQYRSCPDEGVLHDAERLLARLLQAAEDGQRLGSTIEIQMLQALAHQAGGGIPQALPPLQRALTLAEPDGYTRIFVDEGPPMASLLQAAVRENVAVPYATRLLEDFGGSAGEPVPPQPLIEPLSPRELEILTLIAGGLKNQEIADRMFISLNTVLYHNKNIYNKLGVSKRTQAVLKAQELHLL